MTPTAQLYQASTANAEMLDSTHLPTHSDSLCVMKRLTRMLLRVTTNVLLFLYRNIPKRVCFCIHIFCFMKLKFDEVYFSNPFFTIVNSDYFSMYNY